MEFLIAFFLVYLIVFVFSYADSQQKPDGYFKRDLWEGMGWARYALCTGKTRIWREIAKLPYTCSNMFKARERLKNVGSVI